MSRNPELRLARSGDASWIAHFSRRHIEHGLQWRYDRAQVMGAIRHPAMNVVVAAGSRYPLGFGVMEYGMQVAHLVLLGVHPHCQRRGLGRALVEWLEKPARLAGIARVRVEVRADNPGGIGFYERLGYHRGARIAGYYDGRLDALRLEKSLRVVVE
jgi:ribosomal protein S18 acetylase RimI-like enzyme